MEKLSLHNAIKPRFRFAITVYWKGLLIDIDEVLMDTLASC